MSPIQEICRLLRDPNEDWLVTENTITNRKRPVKVWRGFFMTVMGPCTYEPPCSVSMLDRFRIWLAGREQERLNFLRQIASSR